MMIDYSAKVESLIRHVDWLMAGVIIWIVMIARDKRYRCGPILGCEEVSELWYFATTQNLDQSAIP